ncbi:MAG TPA: UDP-N-acetylmuramate--L-alanine ligase [Thermoleophilaceae bacterium]|nr:UDP-N-acetylmuramate--L-alanine ligase [Thermoleophilaceae bacterium]
MRTLPFAGRRLHLIGVGGTGMSGLALVARALGAEVTGSDRAESSYTERLRAAGIVPTIGHASANVPSGAEVVVSTAIAEDNIELAAARAGGSRVMHRSDLLAEIAALGRAIAITGTHGKTTTAAMAAHALVEAGRDPAYLIGGVLRSTGTNAAWGEGGWIVVEADESDRSFLKLSPEVAVVTNVELDHHATYASVDELERAMADFAASAPVLVAGEDVPGRIAGAGKRTVRYGRRAGDLTAHELALRPLGARFRVDDVLVELTVPGRHNVLNALAAIAACREAGLPVAEAATGLASYAGAGRRFEPRGRTTGGAEVYDDYAHHPTEVRATLEAARALGAERVVACFQPHLFSRTRHLARDFGSALAVADVVVVLEVYPARERAEDFPEVSGRLVAAAAADAAGGRRVFWAPSMADAEGLLRRELRPGDALLTLGAGNVDALADALVGDPAPEPAMA